MRIDELGVGDEDESVRICAVFLEWQSALSVHLAVQIQPTQFSQLSQSQLFNALLKTARSPQYNNPHQVIINTLTSVNKLLKLHLPLFSAFCLS